MEILQFFFFFLFCLLSDERKLKSEDSVGWKSRGKKLALPFVCLGRSGLLIGLGLWFQRKAEMQAKSGGPEGARLCYVTLDKSVLLPASCFLCEMRLCDEVISPAPSSPDIP